MSEINQSIIRIPSYLCGPDDRLTQAGLAAIFQEEAWLHARSLGFDFTAPDTEVFWVLSRVVWHVRERPRWDEVVVTRTWPSGIERLLAIREFEIYATDAASGAAEPLGEPLVRATSGWVILSAANQRPVPPARHLDGRLVFSSRTLDIPLSRLTQPEPPADAERSDWAPVPLGSIDRNEHVNNTAYVTWMGDLRPLPDVGAGELLAVHYTSEARAGEHYRIVQSHRARWVEVCREPTEAPRIAASVSVISRL